MTGESFLKSLDSKLDFMSYKDRVKILSFYSDKIVTATSPEEESKMVEGFGEVDVIVDNIRTMYKEMTEIRSSGDTLTFNPEIIHDINKPEHIKKEKAFIDPTKVSDQKIKKADSVSEKKDIGSESKNNISKTRVITAVKKHPAPVQSQEKSKNDKNISSDKSDDDNTVVKELWLPDTKGLFGILMEKLNVPSKFRLLVFIGLLILFTPFLLCLTVLLFALYIASIAVILAVALCLFLIVIIPSAIAVIDLSYGIVMLFQNVTVALIEIGIGTMIFGIVIALIGVGYQLVAGTIPKILKKLTQMYKYAFTILKTLVFGK